MAKKKEFADLTLEEKVEFLAGEQQNLKAENEALGKANEKLATDNEALAKEVAEWKGATKKDIPKEAKKPTVPKGKFKVGEDEYKFKVAIFNLPGFGPLKSSDALNNDKALARLVEINASGIIEKC